MTFYSYPKYYANKTGALVPVRTAFVESKRDDWDYEVSTGIWTLLVREDGTFCAEHAGESFTYRLRDMGVAQASGHTALDWGEADWSNLLVMGDTARWDDVYPGVSVTVRYIHDIMKVDLLLSTEARARLEKEQSVLDGASDGRLAFRFDLSNLQTRPSEIRDSESQRNLSETFDIDGPLEFVKDGQVLHSLRPAVAWVLDENGEIPREAKPLELTRRWDGSGMAKGEGTAFVEIGLSLEDLLNAPPGPIAVDPSMTFTGSSDVVDTLLDGATNNGTDESIYWYDGDNIAIGFDVSALGTDKGIISANLSVYEWYSNLSAGVTSRAYWLTEAWEELNATWTVRTSSQNWTTQGGTYTTTNQSAQITLPDDDDEWVTWDVTDAFRAQYPANADDIETQGFLLKRSSDPTNKLKIRTSESTYTSYRPKLVVEYVAPPETITVYDYLPSASYPYYSIGPEIAYPEHFENDPVVDWVITWSPSLPGHTYHVKLYSSTAGHDASDPNTWHHVGSISGDNYDAVLFEDTDFVVRDGAEINVAIQVEVNPRSAFKIKYPDGFKPRIPKAKPHAVVASAFTWPTTEQTHLTGIKQKIDATNYLSYNYTYFTDDELLTAISMAPVFKVFYVLCHGVTQGGNPAGVNLCQDGFPYTADVLFTPASIPTLPPTGKYRRRLLFFNSCSLANTSDNHNLLMQYLQKIGAYGTGTWNKGAAIGYQNTAMSVTAMSFGTAFFDRCQSTTQTMQQAFNYAVTQSGISGALPVIVGGKTNQLRYF